MEREVSNRSKRSPLDEGSHTLHTRFNRTLLSTSPADSAICVVPRDLDPDSAQLRHDVRTSWKELRSILYTLGHAEWVKRKPNITKEEMRYKIDQLKFDMRFKRAKKSITPTDDDEEDLPAIDTTLLAPLANVSATSVLNAPASPDRVTTNTKELVATYMQRLPTPNYAVSLHEYSTNRFNLAENCGFSKTPGVQQEDGYPARSNTQDANVNTNANNSASASSSSARSGEVGRAVLQERPPQVEGGYLLQYTIYDF